VSLNCERSELGQGCHLREHPVSDLAFRWAGKFKEFVPARA
jgi:hypothetical protein